MAKKKKNAAGKPAATAPQRPAPPRPGSRTWIVMAAVCLLILAGAFFLLRGKIGSSMLRTGKYKDYNVLFVTLDTLRADHLPAYGYQGVRTPNLDAVAAKSYVFENAISQIPLTLPSHASMFTGKLPIGHGVRDNAGFFLDEKETTLAELFKQAGYATSGFISSFVLESRWKVNQGFDVYYDNFNMGQFQGVNPRDIQRPGEETVIEAGYWLDANSDKKFFCWVHLYDPHDPYDPPEPFWTDYADNHYDGEIAYTDLVFGHLTGKLNELGIADRTIIVIAGDHGESLGEHQEMTHAMFLYQTTQHVPLFIHLPGGGAGRVKGTVSLTDIAPTLLELAGLKLPEMQGESLLPKINNSEKKQRMAYSESIYAEVHYGWSPLHALTTDTYKFIKAPRPELYDISTDKSETRNLFQEKASIARVLERELEDLISKYASKTLSGPQKMDPETEEKLKALGYIGSAAVSTPESRKIDPKDKIHLARAVQIAFGSLQEREFKQALIEIEPVLKEDPTMVDGHFVAGVSYVGLKQYDAAIDELLQTLALRSDHTMALFNLGHAYELKGNLDEAESWYLKVLQYEPTHHFTTIKLAHLYRIRNEPEKARQYFLTTVHNYQRALDATKGENARSALHSTLGEIYFGAGNLDRAEQDFKSAIQLTPDRVSLHYNLAQIYEARGDFASAENAYRREIELNPDSYKSFNNLGLIYRKTNRLGDAAMCFQKVVDLDPDEARGYLLLAGTYRQMGRPQDAGQVIRMAQQRGIPID